MVSFICSEWKWMSDLYSVWRCWCCAPRCARCRRRSCAPWRLALCSVRSSTGPRSRKPLRRPTQEKVRVIHKPQSENNDLLSHAVAVPGADIALERGGPSAKSCKSIKIGNVRRIGAPGSVGQFIALQWLLLLFFLALKACCTIVTRSTRGIEVSGAYEPASSFLTRHPESMPHRDWDQFWKLFTSH